MERRHLTQPRFLSYCIAHNRIPDEMLEADRIAFPGGAMTGYIIWVLYRRRDFQKHNPGAFSGSHLVDQDAFTEYLHQVARSESVSPTPTCETQIDSCVVNETLTDERTLCR